MQYSYEQKSQWFAAVGVNSSKGMASALFNVETTEVTSLIFFFRRKIGLTVEYLGKYASYQFT